MRANQRASQAKGRGFESLLPLQSPTPYMEAPDRGPRDPFGPNSMSICFLSKGLRRRCASPDGATLGADACDIDNDNDRCPNANELGANPSMGGDRDPQNPWDFFDTPEPVLRSGDTSGTRS